MGTAPNVRAADADDEANDESETPAERDVLDVKIEVKRKDGRVIKSADSFIVDWDVQTALAIQAEGNKHEFSLLVQRKGEDKKTKDVSITVGYDIDGEPIIAPFTFDSKVKKREVLRIEGGMAIALTLTPKTIKAEGGKTEPTEDDEEAPEEEDKPRDKIEIEDGDDPLGGVE